jgi:hypothetical protein
MRDAGEIRLHRIMVSASAVAELVGRQALVSIPRKDVRRLRIEHRLLTERPAILAGFGIAATAVGALALLCIAYALVADAMVDLRVPALGLVLVFAGPAMIFSALRRGLVLLVDTARTTRKLGFGAKLDPSELGPFVDAVRASGLEIEVNTQIPRAWLRRR